MFERLLRAIDQSGTATTAELARKVGVNEPLLRQALRDLERRGYLEPVLAERAENNCAPACADCPILPKCFSAAWNLTEKSRKYLIGSQLFSGGEKNSR